MRRGRDLQQYCRRKIDSDAEPLCMQRTRAQRLPTSITPTQSSVNVKVESVYLYLLTHADGTELGREGEAARGPLDEAAREIERWRGLRLVGRCDAIRSDNRRSGRSGRRRNGRTVNTASVLAVRNETKRPQHQRRRVVDARVIAAIMVVVVVVVVVRLYYSNKLVARDCWMC